MNEREVWQYIDGNKSKDDLVDNGFILGHIGNYESKEKAKRVAERIREIWPTIRFKLITNSNKSMDLFGNYYKFYESISKEQYLRMRKINGMSIEVTWL